MKAVDALPEVNWSIKMPERTCVALGQHEDWIEDNVQRLPAPFMALSASEMSMLVA